MVSTEQTTQAPAEAPATPAVQPATPEPTPEEFMNGLLKDDGSLNAEAVAKAEPDRAPEGVGPKRGPDGKFVSETTDTDGAADKADDAKTKDTEPDKAKAKDGEEDADTEGEGEAAQPVKPPASMSAKDREAFYKLPADQQKWLVETAKGFQSGASKQIGEYAGKLQKLEPLDRLASQYEAAFAHRGQSVAQGFSQLAVLAQEAERDWPNFVREQSRLRGFSPEQIFGTHGGAEGQPSADPRLETALQRIELLTEHISRQEQERTAQTLRAMETSVAEFEKDPAYPFYADVVGDLVPLVRALREQNPQAAPKDILAKAYNAALAMNPEAKAKAEADRIGREEAERQRKAAEAARNARRSASGNIIGNGALPPGDAISGNDLSQMNDFIGREFDRLVRA